MDKQMKINNSYTIDADQLNLIYNSFENFSRDILQNSNNRLSDYSLENLTKHFELYLNSSIFQNTTMDSERDSISVLIPITIFYVLIFLAGLLGNVITCTVISRNKVMHTATNCYLFNLAISDLILLISGMPPDIYSIWYPAAYPFSHSICVVQGLLSETSANATVLTITSFTIERYIAICHPFRQHKMSKIPRTVKFIISIWVLAFCLASPQAFQFSVMDYDGGGRLCTVRKSDNDAIWAHAFEVSGFLFFVGPMTVICVLYVLIGIKLRQSKLLQGVKRKGSELDKNNEKRTGQSRVIRMLVAVAVAFFLCWAPFHAQRLMAVYGAMQDSSNELFGQVYLALTYISGILYFLSTCINPLLYSIMSHKFRDAFKICDNKLRIRAVNATHGGSCHDSMIWNLSAERSYLSRQWNSDKNSWLLGDSGYPLEPWVITPYRAANENTPESRFNSAHSQTRNAVERCIGVLKARFRCLLAARELHYTPKKVCQIINVCSMLHNVLIHYAVDFDEPILDLTDDIDSTDQISAILTTIHQNEARRIRNQITRPFY